MMFPPNFRSFVVPLIMGLAAAASQALPLKESFDGGTDGKPVGELPGWSTPADTVGFVLSTTSGFSGGGLEISREGHCERNLSEDAVITSDGKPAQFRVKIKFDGDSAAYAHLLVDLRAQGGINGLGIHFIGSANPDSEPNQISVSSGGTSWGDVQNRSLSAPWVLGVWYQVEFNDITFGPDGPRAKLTIYPAKDPSHKLVENELISSYGEGPSFQRIDQVSLASTGAARTILLDDLEIREATPKPASPSPAPK